MPKQLSKELIARARGEVVPKKGKPKKAKKIPPTAFKPGNKAAVKHGAYGTAFITPEEKEQFLALRLEIAREFKAETGPDTAMLDAAALLFIRHGRAVVAGEQDLANKTMASILAMLDRLKATKVSREGDKPVHRETTPAEWASALLAKDPKKKAARENAASENAEKRSDNTYGDSENTGEPAPDSEEDVE